MRKRLFVVAGVSAVLCLSSVRSGRACVYSGNVTCNTYLGTACDGLCDNDVCDGTQVDEYSCSDGSVQFVNE